tara:strand:- start:588 stop:4151 length:3564 start_codon:yes stop_codon:yes gene_type:complete
MTISFRTQTFHDIRNKIGQEELTTDQVEDVITSYGISSDEYKTEFSNYLDLKEKGEINTEEGFGPGLIAVPMSAMGRAAEGVVAFGDMVLPESITNTIEEVTTEMGTYIPEEVKRTFQETFDPYHGEGLAGATRDIAAEIGSYLVTGGPFGMAMKGIVGAGKLAQGTAAISGATAIMTASERPEDNIVNVLLEEDLVPDWLVEGLRNREIDPDDPKNVQYIDQLINNLGIESVLGGALIGGGKVLKGIASTGPFKSLTETTFLKPGVDKVKSLFTANRGTDDTMLELAVEREGAAAAAFTKVRSLNEPLEKILKDAGLDSDEYLEMIINPALMNDVDALLKLNADSSQAADIVKQMRGEIDTLSSFVSKNFVRDGSSLQAGIDKNMGFYLNRSYRAFDDPTYKFEDIDEEVLDRAAKYLIREEQIPQENVAAVLKNLVDKNKMGKGDESSLFKFLDGMDRASTSKPLKKRTEIPKEIKDLWGETKNPFKNFQNTLEKLSGIKAEYSYLDGVARHLRGNNLAREGVGKYKRAPDTKLQDLGELAEERMAKIFSGVKTGQYKNPLEGLYGDKNYQSFIRDTLGANGFFGADPNSVVRTFLKFKSASQLSKTVLNPSTHFRNVMGNVAIMTANGMIGNGAAWKKAMGGISSRFKNLSSKELGEQLAQYQQLGIVDSGVTANIIRQVASDAFKMEPNGMLSKALDKSGGSNIFKAYQAEDDIFKIVHFEKTKDYLRKAFPDLEGLELDRLAARRTRDLMPNYNLVPKAFKKLRGAPVGDFLAFPAEMMRISKNLVKYTMQDMASGNKTLRRQAYKRAAGMSAAGLGGDMAMDYSASLFAISPQEQEAMNKLVPSYSANTGKVFLSPFKKVNGSTVIDYIDLGPLDPFEYLKTASRTLHNGMDKLFFDNQEWTDDDSARLGLQMMDQVLGPFLGTSMITEGMLKMVGAGEDLPDTPTEMGDFFTEQFLPGMSEVITPGFINFLKKRYDFQKEKAKQLGEEGITFNSFTSEPTGSEVTKHGYSLPAGGAMTGVNGLEEFFGLKKSRLDLNTGMRRNILPVTSELSKTGTYINKALGSYEMQSPDNVYGAYKKGQVQKLSKFRQLQQTLDAYRSIFGNQTEQELIRGLSQNYSRELPNNVANFINAAKENTFIPDGVSETMANVRFETNAPLPLERINELYQQLLGSSITSKGE